LGGGDALATPSYWDDVKDPLMAEYFPIRSDSQEYHRVVDAFLLTLDRRKFKVHSVQRVQNIGLWQSYCVKKSSTVAREDDPSRAERKYVRNWLWHGCPGDVVPKILQQGFNRSFCGENATLYGKGVYFARDASYSTYPLYCAPDATGVQSIFAVRAVVGQYSRGARDALTPDIHPEPSGIREGGTAFKRTTPACQRIKNHQNGLRLFKLGRAPQATTRAICSSTRRWTTSTIRPSS